MNKEKKHIDTETKTLFSGGKFEWEKSKDSVWSEMFENIEEKSTRGVIRINKQFINYGIAASLILLIGISSFLWFYSKTVISPNGTHLVAQLPDGSSVEMNAGSTLKYHPYRWIISREVSFEGEGFFEIEKGKRFQVRSNLGNTEVLGTSFNIYSREDIYNVVCLTGKVRVSDLNKKSIIINPNQGVYLKKGFELNEIESPNVQNVISWRNYIFRFTAVPFQKVVSEIERQYGIKIKINDNLDGVLTCNFSKVANVEEVLSSVCRPLGYEFVKKSKNSYLILGSN